MRRKYLSVLRDELMRGCFGAEGRLPSFRELAARYDCSVASIKLAVDTLQHEGILEPIHGKGTFIANHGSVPLPRSRRSKLIGAVLLHPGWLEVMESLRYEWQRNGWFFSLYDACADMQDPARERDFLNMAQQEGFAGVLLIATPLAPVNTELFAELRRQGMKVAHLAPYQDDMSHETGFLLDYAAGARLALREARAAGFRRVLPVRAGARAPSLEAFAAGLRQASDVVEQLPTFFYQQWQSEWRREKEHWDDSRRWQDICRELQPLLELPPDTLILAYRAEDGMDIRRFLAESGRSAVPEVWALDSMTPDHEHIVAVRYDIEAQIRGALDYVCDDTIDPIQQVQRFFPPVAVGMNIAMTIRTSTN